MAKEIMTTNRAVAEAVKLAKPQVVPVYPITPQTTISEYLAQFVADGDLDAEYIRVESEHSAISATLGASEAGVRVFTATSSQGLMLMHEILFAAAGMRAPIVMADANRAIEVMLPVMVCLDGFILTHTVEPVDLLEQAEVDTFLEPYVPKFAYLDPERPMSLGNFADPEYYTEARHDMQVAMDKSMEVIKEVGAEFGEKFGREYGLTESYLCEDAEIILVCMGSMASTVRYVVDNLREKGEKVGLLKIRSYRPFPFEEIDEITKNADKLAVLDKNFSFGIGGALFADIKTKCHKETYGFILGRSCRIN